MWQKKKTGKIKHKMRRMNQLFPPVTFIICLNKCHEKKNLRLNLPQSVSATLQFNINLSCIILFSLYESFSDTLHLVKWFIHAHFT